ncbi:MAG: hypothetical protein ACLU85_00710 [Lachnospirales bacterium]
MDELAAVLPDGRYAPNVSGKDAGKLLGKFLISQENMWSYTRNKLKDYLIKEGVEI